MIGFGQALYIGIGCFFLGCTWEELGRSWRHEPLWVTLWVAFFVFLMWPVIPFYVLLTIGKQLCTHWSYGHVHWVLNPKQWAWREGTEEECQAVGWVYAVQIGPFNFVRREEEADDET